MVKIMFMFRYKKMEGVDLGDCRLIRVDRFKVSHLSREFVMKDCETVDGRFYKGGNLGFENGLMLLIKDSKGKGFVTLRSFSGRKFEYYKSKVGERVDVVFTS